MSGRICLVTGATRGIGLATARALARKGASLALVCRDPARGKAAAESVRAAGGGEPVDLFIADLSLQAAVRRLAAEVRNRYASLQVVIHNAGIVTPERILTADGVETQLAVNHLAPFLLTGLLLDHLRDGAPARVVVVASQVERGARIAFDDLMGERDYDPHQAYGQSKLANVLFTYELARRVANSGITANCLHPGVVRTNLLDTLENITRERDSGNQVLQRVRGALGSVRRGIRGLFPVPPTKDWAIAPEEGARTAVRLATDPGLVGVSGRFFREGEEAESSPQSRDPALARRLWEESERLTGLRA